MADSRFAHLVPKDYVENLKWRLKIRKAAALDANLRGAIWQACKDDILFFLNGWVWLYEPRIRSVGGVKLPHQLPFITWDHQDPVIVQARECLDSADPQDIGMDKSRGEGASWIFCMLALHDWLFYDMAKVGLVSQTEDKADNPDDPDSLFWKIDWQLQMLPKWMAGTEKVDWKRNRDQHTLVNHRNGSRIAAYSATGDVGRGGRCKWFLLDEHAAWKAPNDQKALDSLQHVTDHRALVSTPQGATGAFYDVMHTPSNILKLVLDWKDNPWRNRGLYRYKKGRCIPVDVEVFGDLPENYEEESKDLFSSLIKKGYDLEGSLRSPWYDVECDRAGANPQSIAQELDRDYGGSMHRIYGPDFQLAAEPHTRPPMYEGDFEYRIDDIENSGEFLRSRGGPMKIWMELDVRNRPSPYLDFVIGGDIAAGQGGSYSSNSVITAIERQSKRQVLEYATNHMEPRDFANLAMSIGYWLNNAYLAWEHAGPGTAFTKFVLDNGYEPVYRRETFNQRGHKKGKAVGWSPQPDAVKEDMHSHFNYLVRTGQIIVHSQELIVETGQYVRLGGKIVHVGAHRTQDDSSKGQAHGDRVVAIGVACQALKDFPDIKSDDLEHPHQPPPLGTMARRMRDYAEELEKEKDDWDNRTAADMAYGYTPFGDRWD